MLIAASRTTKGWQPQAPNDYLLAGLGPRRDLDFALAVSVGTVTLVPSMALVAGNSTTVTRS